MSESQVAGSGTADGWFGSPPLLVVPPLLLVVPPLLVVVPPLLVPPPLLPPDELLVVPGGGVLAENTLFAMGPSAGAASARTGGPAAGAAANASVAAVPVGSGTAAAPSDGAAITGPSRRAIVAKSRSRRARRTLLRGRRVAFAIGTAASGSSA